EYVLSESVTSVLVVATSEAKTSETKPKPSKSVSEDISNEEPKDEKITGKGTLKTDTEESIGAGHASKETGSSKDYVLMSLWKDGQPTEPQHTPTTASLSHIVPIPTVASSSQPKKTQKHRKTKRKATEISQSSGPTTLVAYETVHEEKEDRVEMDATTAASLDAEQDGGTINRTQSTAIPNEPIPQGTGSEIQGRYGHDIEINIVGTLITTASINITTVEPVTTVSTPITTAGVFVSTAEPSTPPTTPATVIKDKDLTIAQTLMKMRSEKSKEKSKERGSKENYSKTATRPTRRVIMREASKTTTRPTIPPQQKLDPKNKGKGKMVKPEKPLKKKDQIEFDKEVAQRLQAQLQAELEEEERIARQKEEDANIAEWDDVQAMMDADHELAE
nr:hypothetical protein [Tanacetum cinerariifolium]